MRADLGTLLDDDDGKLRIELLQPDRGGQARGPGTDDHDIELHPLAGGQIGLAHGPLGRRKRQLRAFPQFISA